jgi:ferritin-like metal-binding protein YciE
MNDTIKSKEIKITLSECAKNIHVQIENLNHRFYIIQGDLNDSESKIIKEIINNSKKILKNIYQKNILDTPITYGLKQDVHTLLKECEIACIYGKVKALEERANYLHKILGDEKAIQENLFWEPEKVNTKEYEYIFH